MACRFEEEIYHREGAVEECGCYQCPHKSLDGCHEELLALAEAEEERIGPLEAESEQMVELDAWEWYQWYCDWKWRVAIDLGVKPTDVETTFLEWLEEENLLNPISQTCPDCPECGSHDREDVGDAILCRECSWAEAKMELRERELAQMPHEGRIYQ